MRGRIERRKREGVEEWTRGEDRVDSRWRASENRSKRSRNRSEERERMREDEERRKDDEVVAQ